jgi:hypothetical protein
MTKSNTAKQRMVYLECENFQAVSCDFTAAYQRVKKGVQCNAIEESKAFAFFWAHREALALGKDAALAWSDDPELAAELSFRLLQWRAARLEWHLLLMRKECPAAFDDQTTQRSRDAAWLGVILGDKTEKTTDRLIELIKRRSELSEREWRVFTKTARENKPAGWRHPDLDTFLTLIWPIVERFNWTYRDVLDAVQRKFPGQHGYPFDALDKSHPDIAKHCRGLGLRTANKPRRHPKGKALLLGLTLEISTETDLLRRLGFLGK